jgi:FKBP-type peptidyl-prolyl cis-trans isomerase 2
MRAPSAIVAIAVAVLLVASSGCLKDDEGPTIKVKLDLRGESEQNVVQGNNTTFLFAVENDYKANATLLMSLDGLPDGWDHSFSPQSVVLAKNKGHAVWLNLTVPLDTENKGFDMKVTAKVQGKSEQKRTVKISVYVLDQAVSLELNVVSKGDTVYFNYTGMLLNGTVFDTTDEDTGTDGRIAKLPDFSRSSYDPQPFLIGNKQAISGFESGVMGMRQGEYKTIFVPEDQAYSIHEDVRINLTEVIPMRESWLWSDFTRAFRQEAAMHLTVTHRKWNVTCEVVAIDNETDGHPVTVELQPTVGQVIKPYGWDTRVESIDSQADGGKGEIVLRHLVTAADLHKEYWVYNSTAPKEVDYGVLAQFVEGSHVVLRVQRSHHDLAGQALIFVVKVHEFKS